MGISDPICRVLVCLTVTESNFIFINGTQRPLGDGPSGRYFLIKAKGKSLLGQTRTPKQRKESQPRLGWGRRAGKKAAFLAMAMR